MFDKFLKKYSKELFIFGILIISVIFNIKKYNTTLEPFTDNDTIEFDFNQTQILNMEGIIIPYIGDLKLLEGSGWFLCDGNNGTPNLTRKFLMGGIDGVESDGGTTGVKMDIEQMPSHSHRMPGFFYYSNARKLPGYKPQMVSMDRVDIHKHNELKFQTFYLGGSGKQTGRDYEWKYDDVTPFNNIPPYYVVNWIIYMPSKLN